MPTPEASARRRRALSLAVELFMTVLGVALLALAARLDPDWVSRHITQLNLWPEQDPRWYSLLLRAVSAGAGIAVLTLLRPLFARFARTATPGGAVRVLLAVVCSLVVFEGYLRWSRRLVTHEALGTRHPRYGWTWMPSHTGTELVAGRVVHWEFDREGIRVRARGAEADPGAPTILFTGESVGAGQGLEYDETYPVLVGAHLGVQPVNLAVNGYGSDQAYLRLVDALPKFSRLVATVTVFLPVQVGRNLQDDKPRLVLGRSGAPELVPAVTGFLAELRMRALLLHELPFTGERAIQDSLALTAYLLRDTAERTRARGGIPLFVIPSHGPPRALEDHTEAWLIHTLFERQDLPFLLVDLSSDLLLPNDPHPNPRGAAAIASAIEGALTRSTAARSAGPGSP